MTLLDAPTTKLYTPQDLLAMSDNNSLELVDGRIVEKNVSIESSETEAFFLSRFQIFLFDHPVARVYASSLGYTCFPDAPNKMRKPDVSVVILSRLRQLPDQNSGYMPIPADLAVEVLSPNDLTYEIDEKVEEYFAAGFPLIWVADSRARSITVHPLNGRPAIYTGDDEMTAEAALPGFRCKVRDFFPVPLGAAIK
jgi:Uma2 family endonuclease